MGHRPRPVSYSISALNKLRGYAEDDRLLDSEIEEMKLEALKASTERKFSLKQLLTIHELRKPLIIAVVLHVAQQWSGINAVRPLYSIK